MEKLYTVELYGPDGDCNPVVSMGQFLTTNEELAINEFERVAIEVTKILYARWAKFTPPNEETTKSYNNNINRATDMAQEMRKNGITAHKFMVDDSFEYELFIHETETERTIPADLIKEWWE